MISLPPSLKQKKKGHGGGAINLKINRTYLERMGAGEPAPVFPPLFQQNKEQGGKGHPPRAHGIGHKHWHMHRHRDDGKPPHSSSTKEKGHKGVATKLDCTDICMGAGIRGGKPATLFKQKKKKEQDGVPTNPERTGTA